MADETPKKEPQIAKRGVQDAGETVLTSGGSTISGIVADITDGDRLRKVKPKKK